jgi:hypothetical protein
MIITKPGIDTKNPPSFIGATVTCGRCTCIATIDENDVVFSEFLSLHKPFWRFKVDCLTEHCGYQMVGHKAP